MNRASLQAQTVKNLPAIQETWVNPQVGKIPWRRKWQPTPVFLPGEFHGQRSLAGYSPWGHKEVDTTERLPLSHLLIWWTVLSWTLVSIMTALLRTCPAAFLESCSSSSFLSPAWYFPLCAPCPHSPVWLPLSHVLSSTMSRFCILKSEGLTDQLRTENCSGGGWKAQCRGETAIKTVQWNDDAFICVLKFVQLWIPQVISEFYYFDNLQYLHEKPLEIWDFYPLTAISRQIEVFKGK